MDSSQPPEKKRSACERVFALPELRHAILVSIIDIHAERHGVRDLFPAMRVCKDFQATVQDSPTLGRIIGFKQYEVNPGGCMIHPRGRCDLDPFFNTLLSTSSQYRPAHIILDDRKLVGAPSGDVHLRRSVGGRQLVGHLRLGNLDNECLWRHHSYSNLHLPKIPTTTIVSIRGGCHFRYQRQIDDSTNIIVNIRGATLGQILDIAYYLKKAAYWNIAAKLFRGDEMYYRAIDNGGNGKVDLPWWRNPDVQVYGSKMQWPWQRFVEDRNLLKLVVSDPIIEERTLVGYPFYKMVDENRKEEDEDEEDGEEETAMGSVARLSWVGADLA